MATHISILAGKSRGQRSLVGYSPLGHKESAMTEKLHFQKVLTQLVKNPPVVQETLVLFLGWEDPLEKG